MLRRVHAGMKLASRHGSSAESQLVLVLYAGMYLVCWVLGLGITVVMAALKAP